MWYPAYCIEHVFENCSCSIDASVNYIGVYHGTSVLFKIPRIKYMKQCCEMKSDQVDVARSMELNCSRSAADTRS